MLPNPAFKDRSIQFWAFVKFASAELGYSTRRTGTSSDPLMRHYDYEDLSILAGLSNLNDDLTREVLTYLNYRADLLNDGVQQLLMSRDEAEQEFRKLLKDHSPRCHLPLNKQKGSKRHYAYFTCIINILTEYHLNGRRFEDNPGQLATISDSDGVLVATLSRRIDGAYPSLKNPSVIWEVKEYYGTTTFGSRVADGVYETQLDGYELKHAEAVISHRISHYLFVDDKYTWWNCGRSYLCRLIDIMHIGLVDEVIFGREVLERWPAIVKSWI